MYWSPADHEQADNDEDHFDYLALVLLLVLSHRVGRVVEINVIADTKIGQRYDDERYQVLYNDQKYGVLFEEKEHFRLQIGSALKPIAVDIDSECVEMKGAQGKCGDPNANENDEALFNSELGLERMKDDVVAVQTNGDQG